MTTLGSNLGPNGTARPFASLGGLELAYPECEKGIGALIGSPESPELIEGVKLQRLPLYPDDRGYFLEVQRFGQGLAAHFPAASSQVSAALSYAGTVKAFHYHLRQTDCWTPVKGMFQVALVDLRRQSPTFGRRNTIYAGALRPLQIVIPPGVGHGYKVIGPDEGLLVYMTDRFYDPADEGRIPYNDPSVHYDWETQHK
jgi:dTDP-4-dehydrorhamnose 3,5-epimerase